MLFTRRRNLLHQTALVTALAVLLSPLAAVAQGTRVSIPKNKYSVADDVKLGQQASREVEQQLQIFPEDSEVDAYVERVGRRLVAAIPPQFRHPQFQYEFDVVNAREINAFALPGGPMYVNRGMIEAARNEGEMAGVMAHEISHVALRHGTAGATKQSNPWIQGGAIGGAILGAIIGGNVGGIVAQGAQLGLGAYLLKYSREYETDADILGAQIMANAGYDPRDLANMFRTIERQSGGSQGPEWLSSHPNPGNRYERINQEAALLGVRGSQATQDTAAFNRIQSDLRRMSPAPSMQESAQNRQRDPQQGGRQYPSGSRVETRVEDPSNRYRTYRGGNVFTVEVPANWREFADNASVTFAPQGAYGDFQGQPVFTHGAMVGVVNTQNRNLRRASEEYVSALLQGNQYLRQQSNFQRGSIDGRNALQITLGGQSPVTGRTEIVTVYTTMLGNGQLFYVIGVAPRDQYSAYNSAFQNMVRSLQLNG
jgi:beta-barrel assembly-enhancing protease